MSGFLPDSKTTFLPYFRDYMKAGALYDKVPFREPLESLPHIVPHIVSYGAAEAILPSNTELVNIKGSTCCAC